MHDDLKNNIAKPLDGFIDESVFVPLKELEPVSIVIVNYNAGSLLVKSVQSALTQGQEVLVVDNGSSDGSIQSLEKVLGNQKGLQILRIGKNLGFATACALGGNLATKKHILFLNPDCLMSAGSLRRLVNELEINPKVGMVGGLLINPDGSEQGGGRRAVPTPWRSFVRAFGLHHFAQRWPRVFFDFHLQKQELPEHPIEVEAISGALMLVRREAISEVGTWDEGYFLHCEDLDWCMRFRQKGWKILFVPDAPVVHHQGACSRSRPIFVEWNKHKGMNRFYRKFFRDQYPGFLMWIVTFGVWFRFSIILIYFSFKHVISFAEPKSNG